MEKKKTWIKTKTWKRMQKVKEKITKHRKRYTVSKDDEDFKPLKVWRPRLFKNPDEMVDLFNDYIASCKERVKIIQQTPVRIVDRKEKSKDWAINEVEYKYEEKEELVRKVTPSKWWFLRFCGWIDYDTWDLYKNREEFMGTVKAIENYLESVLVEQAWKWAYNPTIAQFVLNTTYNRVPKSKSEVVEKSEPLDVNDFIRD